MLCSPSSGRVWDLECKRRLSSRSPVVLLRTELPTDDCRYEEEKERRKEREEEERGAANAVRGGDWDYI